MHTTFMCHVFVKTFGKCSVCWHVSDLRVFDDDRLTQNYVGMSCKVIIANPY